jgi:branched-chain amino acid transport system ATP-binding protein
MTMPAANGKGLALEGVRAGYGRTVVLDGVTLALAPGETLAVLGRNGVGKTTLMCTIMGLTAHHGGTINFDGQDITALPAYARCRLGIGLVPQEREIFPSLTLEENLSVAARPGHWTLERVYDFFPRLAERRKNRGNQLSGGEQQMLAIGRALIGNPSLLLMDEPTEGLAPVIVEALTAVLLKLRAEQTLSIMLVEQNSRLALAFSERTVVMDKGRIVYDGPSAVLRDNPEKLAQLVGVGETVQRH